MGELKLESDTFNNHLSEWRVSHMGKFVLIKGNTAEGFYSSLEEAFKRGSDLYGLEPFLVKQITPSDAVNVSFLGKRLKSA